MGLLLRAGQILLGAAAIGAAIPSCYSAGTGSGPPPNSFYFPVGLAIPPDGRFLYVVNSDFDLQYSGGTLQQYDLLRLRGDAQSLIDANLSGGCTLLPPAPGVPLGQRCAPPVDSTGYVVDHVTIGAFATDLQVSVAPGPTRRLFAPVRGVAALTWVDLDASGNIQCGQSLQDPERRCDSNHNTGNLPDNSRQITMPGEPFGMAQTEDGVAVAITHQTDTKTSLLSTGLGAGPAECTGASGDGCPSLDFVLNGLPTGGVGIAAVPHDLVDACGPNTPDQLPCPGPAFLETNHSSAQIDLLRYYSDDGSSLHRPFLQLEASFPITSNALGTDSRGIAIDPTPRIACKKRLGDNPPQELLTACARLPARVFFASRTPPALGIGEIGEYPTTGTGTYNPDQLVLTGNVPLPIGPSQVYLAPIVNAQGAFELRVFVVLFDSSQIAVYDPVQGAVERYIDMGPGPFGMAFDPFLAAVDDPDAPGGPWTWVGEQREVATLKPPYNGYRFAYAASFTHSFVQMIDLDASRPTGQTFERTVFTLGQPTVPKGQ